MPATKIPDQNELSRARNAAQENYERKMVRPYEKKNQGGSSWADSHEFGLAHGDDSTNSDIAHIGNQERQADNTADDDLDTGTREDLGDQRGPEPIPNTITPPKKDRFHGIKRKRNTIAVTIAVFGAVTGLFGFIGGSAGLLVHFKEVVLKGLSSIDRSQTRQQARSTRIVAKLLSEDPLTKGCGVIKVKCRYKGMTDRQIEKMKARNPGIQIRTEGNKSIFGRNKVKSIAYTDDDGKFRFTTARDFKSAARNSFAFQKILINYNKSRVAVFWDKQWGKLQVKLGLSKGLRHSNKAPPETSEQAKAQAKAEDEAKKAKVGKLKADTEAKLKKGNIFGVLCAVKEIIKASSKIAKIEYAFKMAVVAFLIYNIADTIKSGNATGDSGINNQIALIAGWLTRSDSNGQTASDSFGFQYASRGVLTKDKSYKKYQMGAASDTGVIGDITRGASKIPDLGPLASLTSFMLNKTLCDIAGGPVGTTLLCAATIVAAVASLGVGTGLAVVGCFAKQILIGKVIGIAVPILLAKVVKTTDVTGAVGGELGNIFVGGASFMGSLVGRFHGEKPLTVAQAKEYDKFSDNAQGSGNWDDTGAAIDINDPNSFAGKLANAFLPSAMRLSSSLSNAPSVLASLPGIGLSQLSNTTQARSVIDGQYEQCDDPDYEAVGVATDPFCVPQYGLNPSMALGDADYNDVAVNNKYKTPKSSGFNLAGLFQPQTAHAASGNTRGFKPDNRFDAEAVTAFMCGQAINNDNPCDKWIDNDGEAVDDSSSDTDYQDYISNCLETTDPIGPDSPDMCKPKECVAADSGSDDFRYCMFSQYAEDTGIDDQLEDRDADSSGSSASPADSTSDETAADGTTAELAQKLLDSPNISWTTPFAEEAIKQAAAGQKSKTEARCNAISASFLDSKLLGTLVSAAEQFKIGIGYVTNGCHSSGSKHYSGKAVDINTIDGVASTGGTSKDIEFIKYAATVLPSGSGFGQVNCHSALTLPSGINQFEDSCNHVHMQVP